MDKPAKKPVAKKPAAKKTATKKPAVKKPVAKQTEKVGKAEVETAEIDEESNSNVVVEKEVVAAAPAPRAKKINPVDCVIEKYTENGWDAIRCPKGSLNDIIATRNGRFQYVQVVACDDPKFHGEFKNNFVQNAFSNSATPVFAHVVSGAKGTVKITFEDVNTNNRVIIGGTRKKE